MNVSFTENAWEDYIYWQKMDKKTVDLRCYYCSVSAIKRADKECERTMLTDWLEGKIINTTFL